MSAAGKALSKAIDSLDGWVFGEFRATHDPSKTVWWVGNGGFFFDGYDTTPKCLGLIERHFLARKCFALRNKAIAERLRGKA